MVIVNCSNTQKHENDGFGRPAQHLHRILQCGLGVSRDISFHVVLACNTTERDAINQEKGANF